MDWRKIKTAPKPSVPGEIVRVLAAFADGRVDIVVWTPNLSKPGGYWSSHIMEAIHGTRGMRNRQPTHWMPLPLPPRNPVVTQGERS